MNHFQPREIDMAFVPQGTMMFSDLIQTLEADWTLSDTRRRDMISGLKRVASAIGRTPHDVPCHGRWLQPRLSKVAPAALRISTKTWQNAVSDARSAMAHVGIVEKRTNRTSDLSPEWAALWRCALNSPHSATLGAALCRFVHFLNNRGILPENVTDADALEYREALACNEISKSPDVAFRAAVNGWNQASRTLPEWPNVILHKQRRTELIRISAEELPTSFISDLDQLIDRLANPDPFAEEMRARGLRPTTLFQYRRQIIRFASELVHSGLPKEEITDVAFLLYPEIAERGLRQMLSRTDNKTTKMISELGALLRNLSRITGQSDEQQKKLAHLAQRIAVRPQKGMTRKNRERLRVLHDDKAMLRLLELPERLFAHPPKGKANDYHKALAREDAIAIAILLVCPIRVRNLSQIHLEDHIQRPGDGRAYLNFPEDEVKNERPIEFELPKDVIRMIDKHLAARCPEMCPKGTPWLFPRRDGAGPARPEQIAGRIRKRVHSLLGFEVNIHLFRHIAALNWLDANPGGYEVTRRLLGHSDTSHTINMYSGLEVKSATQAFADLIAAKKGK